MNSKITDILERTPFKTHDALYEAVDRGEAKIKIATGACRKITEMKHPIYANMGMFWGTVWSAIILIAASVYFSNYYYLLLILLSIMLPYVLYMYALVGKRTEIIPILVVIADLLFLNIPLFITLACVCWIACAYALLWWVRRIQAISLFVTRYNDEVFLWAYNSYNLLIEDRYGNTYSKEIEF